MSNLYFLAKRVTSLLKGDPEIVDEDGLNSI